MSKELVLDVLEYAIECHKFNKNEPLSKVTVNFLEELMEYKKLGTLEEVEEAMEKETGEKPRKVLGINGNIEYECGYCGESEAINEMFSYCPWCGKKMDWSDENE